MKKYFNEFVHWIVGAIGKAWIEHGIFCWMFSPVLLKQNTEILPRNGIDLAGCAVIDTNRLCTESNQGMIMQRLR